MVICEMGTWPLNAVLLQDFFVNGGFMRHTRISDLIEAQNNVVLHRMTTAVLTYRVSEESPLVVMASIVAEGGTTDEALRAPWNYNEGYAFSLDDLRALSGDGGLHETSALIDSRLAHDDVVAMVGDLMTNKRLAPKAPPPTEDQQAFGW